ncbi:unnamed protein product [Camellia sinensis]
MDSGSMFILDSHLDKDKLFLNLITIQIEILSCSRTLVFYLLISDSSISADNLGLSEIILATQSGHVAP